MKRLTYYLKTPIKLADDKEIPAYTEIHPIWNESFLPLHHKELLRSEINLHFRKKKIIMCLVGLNWYPLPEDQIGVRR